MKKFGFTLAELLITLTIVGISAALVAPAVSNIMPDANKAKVLKYNTLLNNALTTMFNDEKYRPYTKYNDSTGETSLNCEGLACIAKFDVLLHEALGLDDDTFETADGSFWNIDGNSDGYTVSITIKPEKSRCSYSDDCDTAQEIDTFIFKIDKNGNVSAGDALTDAYLNNPSKLNDKKNDLDRAARFLNEREYD